MESSKNTPVFSPDAFMSERLKIVPFSGIRKVFDKVKELETAGKDVIHWQIGRPDFDTPAHIKQAAADALHRGEVHYAPNLGTPALRRAIGARTAIDTGVAVDGEKQAVVMAGANEGIMVSMLAFINPGDEVIIANPNWHHYKSCVSLAGGVPVEVAATEANGFTMNPDEVESKITSRTKMLCITSPGNPTGCVQSKESLEALAKIAMRHNLLVLSDEIYARIYYGKEPVAPSIYSVPGMAERTIIINGFSKTYSMDGWRLGWTVASEQLTRAILKVRQYTTVCVNTFIQSGAALALSGDQTCVQEMVGEFAKRRGILLRGLRAIEGVTVAEPMGAFYVFPNIKSFGKSSADLADYLLSEHGIATVAGSVFGDAGEGYLRIAYSCATSECERGVERLASALQSLR
ncbi:MAG: pyridoxal phosphate-dependent aminotransferase [Spirochaetae bacterium HGW-Spirochaetae-9]|nr:MAG: pyridoxal phosphate-dependent aminotransferase [Spirochaetae bacterium HGW-Spirochaetae-9]